MKVVWNQMPAYLHDKALRFEWNNQGTVNMKGMCVFETEGQGLWRGMAVFWCPPSLHRGVELATHPHLVPGLKKE
jgi:hypothetical protein